MASSNSNNVQVSFVIKVDGTPIPQEINVLSMRIEKNSNNQAVARIVMLDGSASEENFEISSSALFDSEKAITIEAGYDNQNQQIFSGIITKQSLQIEKQRRSNLEILCVTDPSKQDAGATVIDNTDAALTITYGEDLNAFDADLSLKTLEVIGKATVQGTSVVEPGKYVTINGLGSRFSGSHYISAVVHSFSAGNWLTEISIGQHYEAATNKKIIIIEDDKKITIEDQNSNSIVLSADGISMKCWNDITIESSQSINLKGNTGINLTASGGDVNVNGLNITEKAAMVYSANAPMTKINGEMELSLKAAMININ
jgi:hypothetical protein